MKFASYSANQPICIELIRMLIVACGTLSHSSSSDVSAETGRPHDVPSAQHSENQDSSGERTLLQSARHHQRWAICPLNSATTMKCSQVKTLVRMTCTQLSFPEMVSHSLCRNSLTVQSNCCISCSGGLSQIILQVKTLDVEVLGWRGYSWM